MHKRIAAVDAVRTRQRSSTDVPSSASLVTSHASDQQYEPHQYDNLSQPSADRLIDIHEDPSRDQSQFSHTRRVKTSLTESLKAPKERLDKTPHPIQIHPYRKIEESPHAPARLGQQRASASAENRLYHAYTDALQEETRGRSGGLRKIVDILRDNDGNPIVIEKAALAIGILSENDVATRDVFGLHAAVQTLIQCLSIRIPGSYDRSGIVSTVVYAIACLLRDSPRNVRLFEMFDGPHRMGKAAASERYENCPAIPRNALKALSELKHHPTHVTETFTNSSSSSSSSFSSSTSSSTSRTIRYVLRSMTLHEHRTDVQEHGLDALRTLLARAGKGALSTDILNLSAQATATAFQMHSESREVQWQCLTLLCDLDAMREGLFSLDLDVQSFFGALRLVIIEAKLNGKRRPKLGKSSLELIRRAVEVAVANGWRTQDFKDTAVEAGAVETILDVLDVYGDDAQIVDKICTILRVLHQSDEGRFRMNSVTSVCAILAGIETVNANTTAFLPS